MRNRTGLILESAMLIENPHICGGNDKIDDALICRAHVDEPKAMLGHCPSFAPAPWRSFLKLGSGLGIAALHVKDETNRMGLGSFKALGGAYAVARLVKQHAETVLSRPVGLAELVSGEVRATVAELTVTCASAGNHGLSVAAGARVFGCRCKVYLAASVPDSFEARLKALGAATVRYGDVYEQAMERARTDSDAMGWSLVSDSSWPGYRNVPLDVMRGYLVAAEEMVDEAEASGAALTHLFLQAGVGGFAAPMAAYFRDRLGADGPRIIVVEPTHANCLQASIEAGKLVAAEGGHTVMGRLDCRKASLLAYEILRHTADDFLSIPDEMTFEAMRLLAGEGMEVGESGAAGLGGLIAATRDGAMRETLGIGATSQVLVVATEGVVDRVAYGKITGKSSVSGV